MKPRPLYVGIDLGTSNSTAAVFDGEELTVVRNGQGSVLTPSVVRIDGRGNVLVGARARRFLETDPANTRGEFKRLMGTTHTLEFPASGAIRRPAPG
jgi:molecular chaperone DnaK